MNYNYDPGGIEAFSILDRAEADDRFRRNVREEFPRITRKFTP